MIIEDLSIKSYLSNSWNNQCPAMTDQANTGHFFIFFIQKSINSKIITTFVSYIDIIQLTYTLIITTFYEKILILTARFGRCH